jgi:hypothetical protein
MPMTAYARLMEMQAEIAKLKSLSATRQIAMDSNRDAQSTGENRVTEEPNGSDAPIPGETEDMSMADLRPTLN